MPSSFLRAPVSEELRAIGEVESNCLLSMATTQISVTGSRTIFSLNNSTFEDIVITIPKGRLFCSAKSLRGGTSVLVIFVLSLISIGKIPEPPDTIRATSALPRVRDYSIYIVRLVTHLHVNSYICCWILHVRV